MLCFLSRHLCSSTFFFFRMSMFSSSYLLSFYSSVTLHLVAALSSSQIIFQIIIQSDFLSPDKHQTGQKSSVKFKFGLELKMQQIIVVEFKEKSLLNCPWVELLLIPRKLSVVSVCVLSKRHAAFCKLILPSCCWSMHLSVHLLTFLKKASFLFPCRTFSVFFCLDQ